MILKSIIIGINTVIQKEVNKIKQEVKSGIDALIYNMQYWKEILIKIDNLKRRIFQFKNVINSLNEDNQIEIDDDILYYYDVVMLDLDAVRKEIIKYISTFGEIAQLEYIIDFSKAN